MLIKDINLNKFRRLFALPFAVDLPQHEKPCGARKPCPDAISAQATLSKVRNKEDALVFW
tara:strand:- start:275 stop:454 length:180 start_codon:yes stop_codon:yes gene_type:complete